MDVLTEGGKRAKFGLFPARMGSGKRNYDKICIHLPPFIFPRWNQRDGWQFSKLEAPGRHDSTSQILMGTNATTWLWMVEASALQDQAWLTAWEPGSTPGGAVGFFPIAAQGDIREGAPSWSAAKCLVFPKSFPFSIKSFHWQHISLPLVMTDLQRQKRI